jgi:hypothetical protein
MAQEQMREQAERQENRNACCGNQHKSREHARDLQLIPRFQNAIGQARSTATCAGDKLRNNRANQRKWIRSVRLLGDKWLIVKHVERLKDANQS